MSILMIAPFTILIVIALIYCNIGDYNIGEGMVLSTTTVVGLLYLSGKITGSFYIGFMLICGIAFVGCVNIILQLPPIRFVIVKGNKHETNSEMKRRPFFSRIFNSPYPVILIAVTVILCILYHNDFIQHIDELQQWAETPKYMLEHNRFPVPSEVLGREASFVTGLFIFFFQFFTGYNEGLMYVVGNLFYWIGFLLPFAGFELKRWKESALYTAIIYLSLYSLYVYGAKNLYVDIPLAAWSCAFLGWWIVKTKKKSNIAIILAMEWMFYGIKNTIGMTMILMSLGFIVLNWLISTDNDMELTLEEQKKKVMKVSAGLLAVCAVGVIFVTTLVSSKNFIYLLPGGIQESVLRNGFSYDKIAITSYVFMGRLFGSGLGANSSKLGLSVIIILVLCILLLNLIYDKKENRQKAILYSAFLIAGTIVYSFIIWIGYILTFSFDLSTKCISMPRYMAIWCITIFSFTLFQLLTVKKEEKHQVSLKKAIVLFLIFLFVYGIDSQFVINQTAYYNEGLMQYTEIQDMKDQIAKIKNTVKQNDKVYLIYQKFENAEDELPVLLARYYIGNQMNNTHTSPYAFNEYGCIIRITEFSSLTVRDLPSILEQSDYKYVWICKTNDFLNKSLPTVMGDEKKVFKRKEEIPKTDEELEEDSELIRSRFISSDSMHDGQLYKVVYRDGKAVKLRLVENLKVTDVR